jgi:hypothetical protein
MYIWSKTNAKNEKYQTLDMIRATRHRAKIVSKDHMRGRGVEQSRYDIEKSGKIVNKESSHLTNFTSPDNASTSNIAR